MDGDTDTQDLSDNDVELEDPNNGQKTENIYQDVTNSNLTIPKTGSEEENESTAAILPWDKFFNWVYCICVVTFDLELGQAVEMIYPAHIKLTEKEKANICYLAFPDSNSGCMGDTQFHFRMRQCPVRRPPIKALQYYNRHCPQYLQVDFSYYYGYVYFRQVKDRSVRRGYFQKSVVLVTRFPFINLYTHAMAIIAPHFFEYGESSIEAACHDIDQWSPPIPGHTLTLPLMGSVLQVHIPTLFDKIAGSPNTQDMVQKTGFQNLILIPSLYEVNLFKCFYSILPHVHLLWELVVTAEPIVIMANSPAVCAEMVEAVISIIWPLRYYADFRPFFTIHDSEFKEFTSKSQSPPPVTIAVTNPFFAKTLQHWPHIIRISEMPTTVNAAPKPKIKKGGSVKTLDSKPGVYTRYKPLLQKDKTILKKLMKGIQTRRPEEVQSLLLRRHFLELTQSFIIPLERYMASLMPLQKNISPYRGTPTLHPFNPDDFMKTLETSGPQLTTGIKGDWPNLYKKFLQSLNFKGWYNSRHKEVSQKLETLHIEAISDANLLVWMQDKREVEVVDLILRLKEKMTIAESENLPLSSETLQKLKMHLKNVISSLPEDLRSVLHTN